MCVCPRVCVTFVWSYDHMTLKEIVTKEEMLTPPPHTHFVKSSFVSLTLLGGK